MFFVEFDSIVIDFLAAVTRLQASMITFSLFLFQLSENNIFRDDNNNNSN